MHAHRWTGAALATLMLLAWRAPQARGQSPSPLLGAPRALQLPHYQMQVELAPGCQQASVTQTVRWTNPAARPAQELIFHVYPRHTPTKDQLFVYERTIESFRLDPRHVIDTQGRRIRVERVASGDVELPIAFDPDSDTVMRVALPKPVEPGQSIEVTLTYQLDVPNVQGRFGRWKGVTNLLNWYPILAYFDDEGWHAPPYVAWHQPWLNEAGRYDVQLTLPPGEQAACSGQVVAREVDESGRQRLHIVGHGLRDFALVVSKRFETHEAQVDGVRVQVLAFPEHRHYARFMLQVAAECLPLYSEWFGRYPHAEFRIAEAYFGWNGNETSGMILIDQRVFDAPTMGHVYVDSLVSHEIAHQWWYSTVGTDGFHETWMDEGLVSFLTKLRIQQKYGKDAELIDWPRKLHWLPNIAYKTFVHHGYYLYTGRGGNGRVLRPLVDVGNVHYLFFLAYDKGNRIFNMIHQRIGQERFFQLLQTIYAKYQFRILFVADFKRELEQLTGEDWTDFFTDWLHSDKITDWKIGKTKVNRTAQGYRTTVDVVQRKQINEPTTVGVWTSQQDEPNFLISLEPELDRYEPVEGVVVSRVNEKRWQVTFETEQKPRQIEVDHDHNLLDANPANNRWKPEPQISLTPIYTPVDEVPLVHSLERWSLRAGPNIDQEGRVGLRASLNYPHRFRISPFLAYMHRAAFSSVGVDAQLYNLPLPNVTLGARYQHTLASSFFNQPTDEGKIYLQWNKFYTTSFIYDHLAYVRVYTRFGDNFFPNEDVRRPPVGVEDYRNIRAVGATFHFNTQIPYWNPEKGYLLDGGYEYGFRLGKGESYNRVWGQASGVRRLPDGLGYFSETRLVGRLAAGAGSPDNGEHFRFGGPLRFRGQRSEDTEGSLFWLASADWRFPILQEVDVRAWDNLAALRSLYGSVFYDVGESYLFDESQGVDHAVGVGLYFQLSLLSFLEQLTLRVELGHSLRHDTTIGWFGIYHAF